MYYVLLMFVCHILKSQCILLLLGLIQYSDIKKSILLGLNALQHQFCGGKKRLLSRMFLIVKA